ncbi:zinc uptake protein ZrgA [Psychromarinibacter halotolerans]|uniref:DUF2796 domain-containing protein n=1 Tax=Psychromarinibacter halotolerans TaxID=1775175 RepID=A0ABV7GZQ9_9RHOB|nr:DUF2796 domain-containing protein [Psychromarinibacter halotolerans]MDF0596524.1 DUF2796 domain-containing protein [Psychromarinibacter halotolerans]
MKTISLALLASVAAAPLLAQEHRELSAHVHGVSTLQVAIDGGTVEMRLDAPGMDIVGFEYAPSSETESMAVDTSIIRLSDAATVVSLPDAAGCELVDGDAAYAREEHDDHHDEHAEDHDHDDHDGHDDHEHAEDHDHDHEASHSAFTAHFVFECASPGALTTLRFPYFDQFENAQEIEVQYVTDAAAGSAEVTRDAPEMTID